MSQKSRPVTIAWGGDVNIGRRFHYRFEIAGARNALANIPQLAAADLAIVNLECVVATCGSERVDKGERASYYYRARPEMIEALLRGGVGLVATANNHSGDYGPDAMCEQRRLLEAAGIGAAGSGASEAEAFAPVFRRAGDLNIALLAIDSTQKTFAAGADSPGTAWLSPAATADWAAVMAPHIARARERADIVLVAVHWGANNAQRPDDAEIAAGHALIDAGADAVLGASAHVLQGVEIYRDRPILHDAGDLLFDALSRNDSDGGVFTLELDHRGVTGLRFHPLEIGFCRSLPPEPGAAAAAVARFAQKCAAFGTDLQPGPQGEGLITLTPPERARRSLAPLPPATAASAPAALAAPRAEWLAEEVPPEAALPTPLVVGPMELLGVRSTPGVLDRVGLIGVESWWRIRAPVDCNWRIDFRAEPRAAGPVGSWGKGCSHDPCDWMWPLRRWQPGQIYRDFYTLRPSVVRNWTDEDLVLTVGVVSHRGVSPRYTLPRQIKFALSPKAGYAVLRASPAQYDIPAPDDVSATPKILWTADQLQEITGGRWIVPPPEGWYVGSITHKSKQLESWALPGPKFLATIDRRMAMRHELSDFTSGRPWDIHDKLPALQHLLAGAMVSRPVAGLRPDFPLLQVADPLHALIQLGGFARNRLRGKVVAVTGSAGKTSQSLMLAAAMGPKSAVAGNSALNYNSRVGILHTLANAPEDTDLVIIEAAVSAINAPRFQNIRMVRPDIANVTNVSPSHMVGPDTGLETVARRKANIIEGIAPGGTLLLNREIACFEIFRAQAEKRGIRLLTFGTGEDADFRLVSYDQSSGRVTAGLPSGALLDYRLAAPGVHMARNSLACVAVRVLLGGDMAAFLQELGEFRPVEGRGAIIQAQYGAGEITLVDESYNANPISMQAAIETFAAMPVAGRHVVALGDMAELGGGASVYHRELAPHLRSARPDVVLLCGKMMKELQAELEKSCPHGMKVRHFPDAAALTAAIGDSLACGDGILVKASNSVGLGRLIEYLRDRSGPASAQANATRSLVISETLPGE